NRAMRWTEQILEEEVRRSVPYEIGNVHPDSGTEVLNRALTERLYPERKKKQIEKIVKIWLGVVGRGCQFGLWFMVFGILRTIRSNWN
ncbi:MAG: hypothetical protein N3A65_06830, partial [candidate division WOR-3 bacterium]|nr:hypothetical protein [candidate division WOR-3 bacterium]